MKRALTIAALAVAVGLAVAVAPFASSSPDGLEKVAADKGFVDEGRLAGLQEDAPIPDYAVAGVEDERVATGLAGLLGTLTVFAVGFAVAAGARRWAPTRSP